MANTVRAVNCKIVAELHKKQWAARLAWRPIWIVGSRADHPMRAVRREFLAHGSKPLARPLNVRRVGKPARSCRFGVARIQTVERRITAFQPVNRTHLIFRTLEQPPRITAMPPFVQNFRTWTRNQSQFFLRDDCQQRAQVSPRIRVAVEIKFAVFRFVPVPWDIEINRINAQRTIALEQGLPLVSRNSVIEKSSGMNEKRRVIHAKLRIAGVVNDFDATRNLFLRIVETGSSQMEFAQMWCRRTRGE